MIWTSGLDEEAAKWFLGGVARSRASVQLVCLPHAGGCASSYRAWLAGLAPDVDVLPVQLPGRETRMDEPLVTDLAELVAQLSGLLHALSLRRLALFGHSMGAIIATYICRELERAGLPVEALIVSGHAGPDHHEPAPTSTDLDDQWMVAALQRLDPAFHERMKEPQLRELFLPVVRADTLLTAAASLGGEKLAAPITVIAGAQDGSLAGRNLSSWAELTRNSCSLHMLPGGHFYLAEQTAAVARIVRSAILGTRADP
jgi:surfactin synthase thioesterase subunit